MEVMTVEEFIGWIAFFKVRSTKMQKKQG